MLKRIIMSLTAVIFILGAGSSFAVTLNSAGLWPGVTTKENVISLYGEPMHMDEDAFGLDRYSYEKDGIRLEISFFNDIVWLSNESHDSN